MAILKRNPILDREGFLTSPDYFFWGYKGSEAYFVNMTRDLYFKSIFSDHRICARNSEIIRLPLAQLLDRFEEETFPAPKLSYVFHMAHGGSTLLARALDVQGMNIVYREPAALRQLGVVAADGQLGANPSEIWRRVFKLSTVLLAKKYQKGERVIIKANVPVNFIIPQLMNVHPNTRGIILFAGLEDYLLSILKSQGHRTWVRNIVDEIGNGLDTIIGMTKEERKALSDAEAAACLWMAQIHLFDNALKKYANLKSLDAEAFFGNPKLVLSKAFQFYRLKVKDEKLAAIVKSDLFTRHSKTPEQKFDNSQRLQQKQLLRAQISDELMRARQWVDSHLDQCALPESLPKPLMAEYTKLLN
jgi:hypothetical protein